MTMVRGILTGLVLSLALSGSALAADVSAADRAAILRAASMAADARGQVMNECEEKVTPTFTPIEIAGLGATVLMVVPGGPNTLTCYGDGPGGLNLFQRTPAGFKKIFESRAGYIAVLGTATRGVRDIAFGGPGFSHPVFSWSGTEYVPARRTVNDAVYGAAPSYPE